jgi:ABC-2 type transport system permease protein
VKKRPGRPPSPGSAPLPRPGRLTDIYAQELKTSLAAMFQYRAALGIWLIGNILEPLIYLVVWSTVSGSSGGSVGGFAARDFAAYYIALMLINQVTYTWVMYEFDYRIRQGSFSATLLRPVHPIHTDIADNLASKVVSLPFMLLAAGALTLLFHPAFRTKAWAVAAFIPAMILAYGVRFLLDWIVALAAFWTTRVSAINQIHFMAVLFFSGQIAPLALLPAPLRVAATILPFRWTVGFPVELILGRLTPAQALAGLAWQAGWLLAGLLLLRFAWRASLKNYSAVGG